MTVSTKTVTYKVIAVAATSWRNQHHFHHLLKNQEFVPAWQLQLEPHHILANTSGRISDHEVENSSSVSVTSEEVAWQIKAVIDPLTQHLVHLCELMRELKNEQSSRRQQEMAWSRAAYSSASSGNWSYSHTEVLWIKWPQKIVFLKFKLFWSKSLKLK